jgi:hypothetical protein
MNSIHKTIAASMTPTFGQTQFIDSIRHNLNRPQNTTNIEAARQQTHQTETEPRTPKSQPKHVTDLISQQTQLIPYHQNY